MNSVVGIVFREFGIFDAVTIVAAVKTFDHFDELLHELYIGDLHYCLRGGR